MGLEVLTESSTILWGRLQPPNSPIPFVSTSISSLYGTSRLNTHPLTRNYLEFLSFSFRFAAREAAQGQRRRKKPAMALLPQTRHLLSSQSALSFSSQSHEILLMTQAVTIHGCVRTRSTFFFDKQHYKKPPTSPTIMAMMTRGRPLISFSFPQLLIDLSK